MSQSEEMEWDATEDFQPPIQPVSINFDTEVNNSISWLRKKNHPFN